MRIHAKRVFFASLAGLAIVLAACGDKSPPPEQVSDADRALLEAMKQKEAEKSDLKANPSAWIEVSAYEKFDKGIINSYTQIKAAQFSNRSKFVIGSIAGQLTIKKADSTVLGIVPFTAAGSVNPGESKRLEIAANELSGNGGLVSTEIKSIQVLGE